MVSSDRYEASVRSFPTHLLWPFPHSSKGILILRYAHGRRYTRCYGAALVCNVRIFNTLYSILRLI